MNKFLLIGSFVTLLAGCDTTTNQGALTGAAAGAAIGAAVNEDDRVEGAIVGGVAGAVAGELLGRTANNPNQCVYQDQYGSRYVAACP